MAMYHKKQEELKKIESNNEDDYAHSSWANPNNLKNNLIGGGRDIRWKGMWFLNVWTLVLDLFISIPINNVLLVSYEMIT